MVKQLQKTNSKKDHNARLCTFDIAWNKPDRLGRFKEVACYERIDSIDRSLAG